MSLGADPNADPYRPSFVNNPPLTIESNVLSSVGVSTPSSSAGMNSIKAFSFWLTLNSKVVVLPSPVKTSESFLRVLSFSETYT